MVKYNNHRELVLSEFKDMIDKKIDIKTSLLDVGSNDGYFAEPLAALGWKYIGLDADPKTDLGIKADMHNIPLSDNTIQVVFCSHTFEHSDKPVRLLQEFYRVLKGGGILFMVTPYPCDRQIFQMDKTHWFVLSDKQLGRLLYKTGFVPVDIHVNKNESEDPADWHVVCVANVM